jgi:hypothetical protein
MRGSHHPGQEQAKSKMPGMKMARLCFVLVCTTLSLSGQEVQDSRAAAAIRALEHAWVEGQSRNDNAALDLIFDNSLVYIEYGQLVSKGDYLSRIKRAGPQLSHVTMEPMTVRTFGSTAIVVGTYYEKDMPGAKPVLRRWRFIDTWVYKKSRWVLVAAAATPLAP